MKLTTRKILPYVLHGAYFVTEGGAKFRVQPSHFPNGWNNEYSSKLILRPLSDISNEIEVNGEKFIPLVELLKIKYDSWFKEVKGTYYEKINHDNTSAWFTNHALFEVKVMFFVGDEMSYPEYWVMQKLAEWQIDFNGLIQAGLAIDINTLN